jgi:hypothetical protein
MKLLFLLLEFLGEFLDMLVNDLILLLVTNLIILLSWITGVSVPAVSRNTIAFSVFRS